MLMTSDKIDLGKVYSSAYFKGKLGVYQGEYETRKDVTRRFYSGVIKKFKLDDGFGKKALDVGCAYGYGVEVLTRLGYDAYGCDISEYAVNICNSIHNWSRCFTLDVEQKNSLPENTFHLITVISTIEHFKDPIVAITNTGRALKSSGSILVTTNNPLSPLCLINRRRDDPTHLSVYPPQKWLSLFKKFFNKSYINTYITLDRVIEEGNFFLLPLFGFTTVIKASNFKYANFM